MVDLCVTDAVRLPGDLIHQVESLVPAADRVALREDIGLRIRAQQDETQSIIREVVEAAARPRGGLLARLFGKAA